MRVNNVSLYKYCAPAVKTADYSGICNTSVQNSQLKSAVLPSTMAFLGQWGKAESPAQRAENTVLSANEAKKVVDKTIDTIADVISYGQSAANDVLDKTNRAQSRHFAPYTHNNDVVKRKFIMDENHMPSEMLEYDEEGNLERKTIFFEDKSIQILDFKNTAVVFASCKGRLQSCEIGGTFLNGNFENPNMVLFTDEDHLNCVVYRKDKENNNENICDVLSFEKNENKYNIKFLNGVQGRNFSMPRYCDSIICMTHIDGDPDAKPCITAYLEGFEKTGVNTHCAKKALYYTFDGLMYDASQIRPTILSENPVSYHENMVSKFDENFKPSADTKSALDMMNGGVSFSVMP